MSQQPTRICILGGGFGGLYTALRLSQLPWESEKPEIVLVDQSDRFLFSPLLYELLTGELQTWEIAPPFAELLAGTGVRFYQGVVAGIDIDEQRVQLHDGPEIPYDRLVLALGGETPMDIVPGAMSYAFPFRSLTDAYRLEERLRVLEESPADRIRIAIAGAGYSGVELACKLSDRFGERARIRLIELSDQILRTSPEFNREAANKALEARGVWIDLETKIESIEPNAIALEYKNQVDTIPVDLVIWTIGTRVSPYVRSLPLKQNQRGQLTTLPASRLYRLEYLGKSKRSPLTSFPLPILRGNDDTGNQQCHFNRSRHKTRWFPGTRRPPPRLSVSNANFRPSTQSRIKLDYPSYSRGVKGQRLVATESVLVGWAMPTLFFYTQMLRFYFNNGKNINYDAATQSYFFRCCWHTVWS